MFSTDDRAPARASLPQILGYLVASSRAARGKAELADDIRVLDGKRFLMVFLTTGNLVSPTNSLFSDKGRGGLGPPRDEKACRL
jgi:hypothetical protein